jgi:hypothetical protein
MLKNEGGEMRDWWRDWYRDRSKTPTRDVILCLWLFHVTLGVIVP